MIQIVDAFFYYAAYRYITADKNIVADKARKGLRSQSFRDRRSDKRIVEEILCFVADVKLFVPILF